MKSPLLVPGPLRDILLDLAGAELTALIRAAKPEQLQVFNILQRQAYEQSSNQNLYQAIPLRDVVLALLGEKSE